MIIQKHIISHIETTIGQQTRLTFIEQTNILQSRAYTRVSLNVTEHFYGVKYIEVNFPKHIQFSNDRI